MSLIRNLRSVLRPLSSVLWLLPLAWLWLVLINDLRVEWTVNPEYGYGWAVPFMCLYLLGRRFQRTDDRGREAEGGGRRAAVGCQNLRLQVSGFKFSRWRFAPCSTLRRV